VFPLGMYTAATSRLAEAMALDFLRPVPEHFVYVALFAWVCVFGGLVRDLLRRVAAIACGRATS